MPTVRRRESFDHVAELYARARPSYPQAMVDDLVELASLGPGSRVLEIGCGPGLLTVPLAERQVSLLAVELGSNLAEIARRRLSNFANARVVVADFDRWTIPEPYDLIVAATAFHWLDPATRLRKCARALRPGGVLGIVGTEWSVADREDPFFAASQSCYTRWDPDHDPDHEPITPGDLPVEPDDLSASGLFAEIVHRRYLCEREYDVAQYCHLLETFSNVQAWEAALRAGFLACIAELITTRFGGRIVRHDRYDLWLARAERSANCP